MIVCVLSIFPTGKFIIYRNSKVQKINELTNLHDRYDYKWQIKLSEPQPLHLGLNRPSPTNTFTH